MNKVEKIMRKGQWIISIIPPPFCLSGKTPLWGKNNFQKKEAARKRTASLVNTGDTFGNCFYCFSLSPVVTWLTAEATPPATATYPAALTNTSGNSTGEVSNTAATPAIDKPQLRIFLKSLGVGAFTRLIILIVF